MSVKKVISFATKKFSKRHKAIFGHAPTKEILEIVKKQFQDGASTQGEDRLLYSLSASGQVEFYVLSKVVLIPEYKKKFLIFTNIYCSSISSARRKLYQSIRNRAMELSANTEVKDVAVWCYFDDPLSRKFFKNKGTLNSIQLVGDVKETLKVLKTNLPHRTRKLRIGDVPTTAKIEFLAHKQDKSSRMHQVTSKKNFIEDVASFHKSLIKKAHAFVSLDNKKITGIAAAFPDPKSNTANIGTIAVHPQYHGQGIAKNLYRELLGSLKKAGIQKYIGHSSTTAVLGMSKRMKRVELSRTYVMSLKSFIAE